MRRPITQIGQSVYEWLFTRPAQDAMVAVAKLAAACFGTSGIVNGLACSATSPASMTVQLAPGEVYQLANLENTICGTLPANTANQIVKQGIQLNTYTSATLAAPSTAGYSINYLIEVQYADSDISVDPTTGNSPVVLQFYNSTNSQQPYSGPNGSGQTSNTFRDGVVSVQVLTGVAAATGSQQTPTATAGWIGIAVVSVAYGQTSITSSNITSLVTNTLPAGLLQAIQGNLLTAGVDTGAANACVVSLQPAPSALVNNMIVEFQVAATNTGASTLNLNGLGAEPIIGAAHLALQGGELVAGGKAEVIWSTSLSSWILLSCTGGAQQVGTALHSNQAVPLSQLTAAGITPGRLLNVQIFTSSGTYTPYSSAVSSIVVEGCGGGGGGGGAAVTSSSQVAAGGGGGGAAYGKGRFTSGFTGGLAVTIGAGGTGGTAGSNNGAAGGTTSLGSIFSVSGGNAGSGNAAQTWSSSTGSLIGGSGGTGGTSITGGNILAVDGSSSSTALILGSSVPLGGGGGASLLGVGTVQPSGQGSYLGGFKYGGGGSGGCSANSNSAGAPGGTGAQGILIIYEYA
jgi:hypothetical protein